MEIATWSGFYIILYPHIVSNRIFFGPLGGCWDDFCAFWSTVMRSLRAGVSLDVRCWKFRNTVDGQHPAPPRMMIIPLFIGFEQTQVVQDFFHQQYLFSKVVSTHLCNTPLNLYQQAIKRFLSQGDCLGCVVTSLDSSVLCDISIYPI